MKKIILLFLGFIVVFVYFRTTKLPSEQITEKQAIELVTNRNEVKEWLSLFPDSGQTNQKAGGKPVIIVDSIKGNNYLIHVYEALPDHLATFNWYEVNMQTGEIKTEFTF